MFTESKVKISIQNLSKSFLRKRESEKTAGRFSALEDVNLDVRESEFVAIVGPSGCGKSTLLDMLAGLSKSTGGAIYIDGRKVTGPALDRGIVMQGYALFPWRTVQKNVEYGLEVQGLQESERHKISQRFIEMVGLESFRDNYPYELSGGMKQRVAIARALAYNPDVLLMDEPFGALDAQTREVLQDELLKIWEKTRKTIIFVTHSIDEAIYLADWVVVLSSNPGRLQDVYDVNLRRPRDGIRLTPEYVSLFRKISDSLHGILQRNTPESEGSGI